MGKNMANQTKYLDNQALRSFSSKYFNYVLDKGTNISFCWGINQNEDPLYDTVSPQEVTFIITEKDTEKDIVRKFNLLANIQEEKEKNVKYENVIDKDLDYIYKNVNLKAISTITTVIFVIENNTNIDMFTNIVKYIKKFNTNVILQFKQAIDENVINKLKFITPNINLEFSQDTIESYKLLTKAKFRVDVKIHVNSTNYIFLNENIKVLAKDVRGKVYIDEPFINKLQLKEFENRIKNLKLNGLYLAACNLYKFNESEEKPFKHVMEIINCDATTFSIAVKGNSIYPCECKLNRELVTIDNKKSINQIWFNQPNLEELRTQIIDKTYCQ